MDKKMLQNTFREFKKATKSAGVGIDFALTNDKGDYLEAKYGADATGIWTSDVEETDKVVYVNHDITTEQVDVFYSVFGENYNIVPARENYSVGWAFQLFEKDTAVYAVTYKELWRDKVWERSDEFTDEKDALRRLNSMFINAMYRHEEEAITDIALKRLF